MSAPKVKGLSFLNRYSFVEERFGAEALQRVTARLSRECASVFRISSASAWYPLSQLIELDLAIVHELFGGDLTQARQCGAENLERSIKTVYRLLLRFLDPMTLLKKQASLWSSMVDQGALEVTPQGEREATIKVVGLNAGHEVYCHVLVGSFTGALRACGSESPQVRHSSCVYRGQPQCEYHASW